MHTYDVEYTDAFGREAWVRRAAVTMPELTHYGYDGSSNYSAANRVFERELMRKAKAAMGLTGVRGRKEVHGDTIAFYPHKSATVLFIIYRD